MNVGCSKNFPVQPGRVYLVGAGPGDPGLITVKGLSILKAADVVIYDYLVNPILLHEVPEAAEKIYVGKKAGHHTLRQEEINRLLLEKARQHLVVVRLKGGDPYVFGRGGEEALFLQKSGIPFEVVPGVTAGVAALSYAGIPATLRGFGSILTFVTGHEDPNKETTDINWTALAQAKATLVFYMGVAQLPKIVSRLTEQGKPPNTPAAIVENGTQPAQRVVSATLGTLVTKAAQAHITPPALIIIGDVVQYRPDLAWFDALPFKGIRMVITRPRHQAFEFSQQIRALGAEAIELPTIRIADPASWTPVDHFIRRSSPPDWVVFTSANGVDKFLGRLQKHGQDVRWFRQTKIASIGPGTSAALRNQGLHPDLEPKKFIAEHLAEALLAQKIKGQKIALLRAEKTRDILTQKLTRAGAWVQDLPVYQTIPEEEAGKLWENYFVQTKLLPDWIIFTSSSTAENLFKILPAREWARIKNRVQIATIGPITSQTVQKLGLSVTVEAQDHSISGLVKALLQFTLERNPDLPDD